MTSDLQTIQEVIQPSSFYEPEFESPTRRYERWDITTPEKTIRDVEIPENPWFEKILEKIIAISELEDNWDTQGAPQINPDCLLAAIKLLVCIAQPDTPEPIVLPTLNGGIQFEWHTPKVELEIEILDISGFIVLFKDQDGNEIDWEDEISFFGCQKLIKCINQLV